MNTVCPLSLLVKKNIMSSLQLDQLLTELIYQLGFCSLTAKNTSYSMIAVNDLMTYKTLLGVFS